MPDHVRAEIRIVYPLSFVPLRGSKPKELIVADTVETELRSVSSAEAPKAFVASGTHSRYQGRLIGGKLYMPAVDRGFSRSLDAPMPFTGFPMGPMEAAHLLYPGNNRQDLKQIASRKTVERPTGLTRVIHDGYEEIRKVTLDVLSRMALVDGALYRQSAPPVYAFEARSEGEWSVEIVDDTQWIQAHYAFGLDRKEDAEAFRERVIARGGMKVHEMSRVRVEGFDPDAVATDECARNASYAVSQVLSSFGNWLHTHSPDLIQIALELSQARGGFNGPAQDPAGVHRLLGDLLEAIPETDKSALRRHIPNAMDAIASARDFVPAPTGLTP